MANITERIVEELKNRLSASNYTTITITMKCNGDEIRIIPCASGLNATCFEDIEYYLVECALPWSGSNTLDGIAKLILNYQKEIDDNEEEKKKLAAFYRKHKNDPNNKWFEWYSDWYKDVYGYRPR